MGEERCGHACPECDDDIDYQRLLDVASTAASAFERMGADVSENFDTPQVVRDILRHQARRLLEATTPRRPAQSESEGSGGDGR